VRHPRRDKVVAGLIHRGFRGLLSIGERGEGRWVDRSDLDHATVAADDGRRLVVDLCRAA